jgi:hypothetical protein
MTLIEVLRLSALSFFEAWIRETLPVQYTTIKRG